MQNYRLNAIVAGVLLLFGFLGVVSMFTLNPLLDAQDYLSQISIHSSQFIIGTFIVLVMGLVCAGIAIALYPVLKKRYPGLALGAVGFRLLESMSVLAAVVCLVSLLSLSRAATLAAPGSNYYQTAGQLLVEGHAWLTSVLVLLAWTIGAAMYHFIFFKTRLIPRWLSVWGLVGVPFTILDCLLVIFEVIQPDSPVQVILNLPLGLQEIPLALWLIIKGFNPRVVTALNIESARRA
jgi:hypothetical protein